MIIEIIFEVDVNMIIEKMCEDDILDNNIVVNFIIIDYKDVESVLIVVVLII